MLLIRMEASLDHLPLVLSCRYQINALLRTNQQMTISTMESDGLSHSRFLSFMIQVVVAKGNREVAGDMSRSWHLARQLPRSRQYAISQWHGIRG